MLLFPNTLFVSEDRNWNQIQTYIYLYGYAQTDV